MMLRTFFDKLFNNWQAKLLSFGLAVLLYVAFQIITLDTKHISVPLQIRSEGNFGLIDTPPEYVRIELRGESGDIVSIQDSDIEAFLDISHVSSGGEISIPVEIVLAESLTLIDPLEIQVVPNTITVTVENYIVDWVPVEPSFAGTPLDGYEMTSWESSHKDVKVYGPKSIVESTTAVYANFVDLNEKTQSFSVETNLETLSDKVYLIDADTTTVSVVIEPQIISVAYNNIVPQSSSLLETFTLLQPIAPIAVEISGEMNPLSLYVPNPNVLEVDFSSVTEVGVYTLPVIANIPVGFTLLSLGATEVTVEVIEKPEEDALIIDGEENNAQPTTENIDELIEELE